MSETKNVVQLAEEQVDEEFIDKSIQFINEKANETLYKGSLEIGEYLLKNFFDDDIQLASSRNPRKPKSYKALCEHKELAVPYSTLTIMVRVAAQERFFKENKLKTNSLSYTHKADLIRLNNTQTKLDLAQKCIENALTTRQLSKLVDKTKKKLTAQKKQDQEETAFKNILKVEQLINRSEKAELVTDIKKLRSMRSKTRENLKKKSNILLQQLNQTVKECKTLLKNLEKVAKEKDE